MRSPIVVICNPTEISGCLVDSAGLGVERAFHHLSSPKINIT